MRDPSCLLHRCGFLPGVDQQGVEKVKLLEKLIKTKIDGPTDVENP
jgi:hypothetical protein